jgi:hypothetical protein
VVKPSNPLQSAAPLWSIAAETHEEGFSGTVVGKIRRSVVQQVLVRTFQIERPMQSAILLVGWTGIGIDVPPSYAEPFAARCPKLIHFLGIVARRIGILPLFRGIADFALLELESAMVAPLK